MRQFVIRAPSRKASAIFDPIGSSMSSISEKPAQGGEKKSVIGFLGQVLDTSAALLWMKQRAPGPLPLIRQHRGQPGDGPT
jgi:hypothetical protein